MCTKLCGDGIIEISNNEQCDDHNYLNYDGCSSTCQVEKYWDCFNGTNKSYCYKMPNATLVSIDKNNLLTIFFDMPMNQFSISASDLSISIVKIVSKVIVSFNITQIYW